MTKKEKIKHCNTCATQLDCVNEDCYCHFKPIQEKCEQGLINFFRQELEKVQTIKDWEKEFDRKFPSVFSMGKGNIPHSEHQYIKFFFRQILRQAYEEGKESGRLQGLSVHGREELAAEKARKNENQKVKNALKSFNEALEKARQEGYEQGRLRCLEQHYGEELKIRQEERKRIVEIARGRKFPEIEKENSLGEYSEFPTAKPVHINNEVFEQFIHNQTLEDLIKEIEK